MTKLTLWLEPLIAWGELIEEFEHHHLHELIENDGFARAIDSPRWKGPENCSQSPGSF
jgi:hypothetical protein